MGSTRSVASGLRFNSYRAADGNQHVEEFNVRIVYRDAAECPVAACAAAVNADCACASSRAKFGGG